MRRFRRRRALIEFYQRVDPDKASDTTLIEGLLDEEFEDLRMALLKKYNTVPRGWSEAAPRKARKAR